MFPVSFGMAVNLPLVDVPAPLVRRHPNVQESTYSKYLPYKDIWGEKDAKIITDVLEELEESLPNVSFTLSSAVSISPTGSNIERGDQSITRSSTITLTANGRTVKLVRYTHTWAPRGIKPIFVLNHSKAFAAAVKDAATELSAGRVPAIPERFQGFNQSLGL